jgi:hypothetical protein
VYLKKQISLQNNSPKIGKSLALNIGIKEKIAYIDQVYLFKIEVFDKLKINFST